MPFLLGKNGAIPFAPVNIYIENALVGEWRAWRLGIATWMSAGGSTTYRPGATPCFTTVQAAFAQAA